MKGDGVKWCVEHRAISAVEWGQHLPGRASKMRLLPKSSSIHPRFLVSSTESSGLSGIQ